MEIWNSASWYVQLVFNILLFVLPTLIGLAVVSASGTKLVSTIRSFLKALRPAVDEPSDMVVKLVAEKTGWTEKEVSEFLVNKIDEITALLPEEVQVLPGIKNLLKKNNV